MTNRPWLARQQNWIFGQLMPRQPQQIASCAPESENDTDRLIHQGDAARDGRDWPAAQSFYNQALALDPSRSGIWVQYGHALKEVGQVSAALSAYLQSASIAPEFADTYLQLGHALKLQGRLQAAVGAYQQALLLDPAMSHAQRELGALDDADDVTAPADYTDQTVMARVEALLENAELLPSFLCKLDPEYYSSQFSIKDDKLSCLEHFCGTGLGAGAALNDRDRFDASFYSETYLKFPMTPPDAYRHWLNLGLSRGHAPNLTVWLQDVQGTELHDFDGLPLAHYKSANPELSHLGMAQLAEHLFDGGLIDTPGVMPPNAATASFFDAAAHRAVHRGDIHLAIRILERRLAHVPDEGSTLQFYADLMTTQSHHYWAGLFYEKIIDAGKANRFTYLLLANCYEAQQRPDAAFGVMAQAVRAFPNYPALRVDRARRLDVFFHTSVRHYETIAQLGHITEGQAAIAKFCDAVTTWNGAHLAPRVVRSVALFALVDLPQCRFYRVDQKLEHLRRAGFETSLFNANTGTAEFLSRLTEFQAVIFYRVAPLPNIIPAIEGARALGLITFYEIDDLLFRADEYPGSYESFGGQISRETFTMLAMGVPLFASAMAMCEFGIASTPTLAREMARHVSSGQVFVHRNGMGLEHERYLDFVTPPQTTGPVVVFYGSGTRAHKEDFTDLVEPALIALAKQHGSKVAIVLVGWLPISETLREHAVHLTVIEPVFDIEHYWQLLRQADINIAVLKPSLNVDCKSEIKWMEAALFGIPSVVSRTATYAEVIEDGKTGFLCDTADDWVQALDRLVRDPRLRRTVGLQAQAEVRRKYRVDVMADNIRRIMKQVGPSEPATRKPKILLVNVFYPPQTYGGATRVLHDNVMFLSKQHSDAFELEVFTCIDEAQEDYIVESFVQDGIRVTGVARSVNGERLMPVEDPRMDEIFRQHLKASKPDLIHFHCVQRLSAAVVAAALDVGIPYIITAHDAWWISDNQFVIDDKGQPHCYDYARPMTTLTQEGYAAFTRMQALRPMLFGAVHVLGVSDAFSELYRQCGVPNVVSVPNGLSAINPVPREPSADGRVRLGHVGHMSRHKGYLLIKHILLRHRFDNLSLTVVDHSKPREYKRNEIWGSTPITFVGKYGHADVAALYAQLDVLLAPSLWPESFGLVTREARACGCWVVASDRGAIGGDVTDKADGFVIDVSTPDGLIAVLQAIDQDPERYRRPPPALARPRSADQQSEELASLYRGVLDTVGKKPAFRPTPRPS